MATVAKTVTDEKLGTEGIKENRPRKKAADRRFAGPQAGTRQAEGAQPQGGGIDTRFRRPGRAQPGVLRVGRAAGWRSLPGSDPAFAQGALPELAETCTHGSVPRGGIAPGPAGGAPSPPFKVSATKTIDEHCAQRGTSSVSRF